MSANIDTNTNANNLNIDTSAQNNRVNKLQNEIAKQYIMISASETDDLFTSSNQSIEENVYNRQYQEDRRPIAERKKNPHLLYSKYDKVDRLGKKKSGNKYVSSTSSDNQSFNNNNTKSTIQNLIRKYEKQLEKVSTDCDNFKKQLYQEKKNNLNLQEENGYLKLEKEKADKIKDNQINLLSEKVVDYEDQLNKLTIKFNEVKKKLDEYTPKALKYDEYNRDFLQEREKNEKLSANNSQLNDVILELKKENNELTSTISKQRAELDSIKLDKEYINKNLLLSSNKNEDLSSKISALESEIRDLRKTNQNYVEKLTEKNLNLDGEYKERINRELLEMKEKYEKDIEALKRQYNELIEQKVGYMKEERDEYKEKVGVYEGKIRDKEGALNLIEQELRNYKLKSDEQINYLKLQLSTKTEELNSKMIIYDDQINALSLIRNENESLKEKNDLLRNEIIKLQSDFKAEVADYKAKLSVLNEKVMAYESMENELDKVILSGGGENDDAVNDVINNTPTTTKRRINQCLDLANKLKLSSLENEKMKNLNDQLSNDLQVKEDQINIYKNISEKVNQPYAYLVKNLQDNELEIYNLKKENMEKEKSVIRLTKEVELCQEKIKNMESDLKTIIENRSQINNLQNILMNYLNEEREGNLSNISNFNSQLEKFNYETAQNFFKNRQENLNPFSTKSESMFKQNDLPIDQLICYSPNLNVKDNNSLDITKTTFATVPEWYKKLKEKKNK